MYVLITSTFHNFVYNLASVICYKHVCLEKLCTLLNISASTFSAVYIYFTPFHYSIEYTYYTFYHLLV